MVYYLDVVDAKKKLVVSATNQDTRMVVPKCDSAVVRDVAEVPDAVIPPIRSIPPVRKPTQPSKPPQRPKKRYI